MPSGIPKSGVNSGRFEKGRKPWNYGKKFPFKSRPKGRIIPWNKGLTIKDNRVKRGVLAAANARRGQSSWNSGTKGLQKSVWKGKHLPDSTKRKISKTLMGKYTGENAGNWKGGKSFESYGIEFNYKLKEKIRRRDEHKCQLCRNYQKELKEKLSIHHIDYNKKNNSDDNLISLCRNCHMKTNGNRKWWIKFFDNFSSEALACGLEIMLPNEEGGTMEVIRKHKGQPYTIEDMAKEYYNIFTKLEKI